MGIGNAKVDIVAGLSVAGLILPESIAYGAIAGLPSMHAMGAALAGLVIYALAGRSRFAIVAPTSASAAVLAAALASLGGAASGERLALAAMLVACVGVLFIAAGSLRLGFVAAFVSRPVLRGFAIGLAASIVLRQVIAAAGVHSGATTLPLQLSDALRQIGSWNGAALTIGAVALVLLFALRRWRGVPAAFVVLALAGVTSFLIDFPSLGVPVIGDIALRLDLPALPGLSAARGLAIASASLPLALILFVESWGTARTLAIRHGDALDANRELVALGLANLGAAAAGGQPVGAGFSASSANEAAGASSRLAGAIAATTLGALMMLALPVIARAPAAVLSAVVIAALAHALDAKPIARLWHIDRDQYVATIAAIAVLVLGALDGMLVAVGLSMVAIIQRLAEPRIDRLGRLPGGTTYVELKRHPDAEVDPAILVLRPREPLFFANAERILGAVEAAATQPVRVVVLSLEQSSDLDSSALDVLNDSITRLAVRGQGLVLGRLKDPVRDLLVRGGGSLEALGLAGQRSVAEAVEAARNNLNEEKADDHHA